MLVASIARAYGEAKAGYWQHEEISHTVPRKNFVGLDNYASMFSGREFWGALFKTFYFMGVVMLDSVVLGLDIAVLLN